MNFRKHYDLRGQHAFLSASKYNWLSYDEDKLVTVFQNALAVERGTQLHDLARRCIELGVRLPSTKQTLNMYVNDAIGFRMTPEQILYYSNNFFGTADTICCRDGQLRIHDLKTGATPTKMDQLEIYAALFCLEYLYKPEDISMELRIYQTANVVVHHPEPRRIQDIMDKIVLFDKKIEKLRQEEEL